MLQRSFGLLKSSTATETQGPTKKSFKNNICYKKSFNMFLSREETFT